MIPHPSEDSASWDTALLAGTPLPGVAVVEVSRKAKIDQAKGKGQSGAKATNQGDDPADVTITLTIAKKADFESLETWMPDLEPPPGKQRVPMDLVHPVATLRNIQSILVEEVEGPSHKGKQIFELKIKAKEWRQPKDQKSSSPNGAVGSDTKSPTGSGGVNTVLDQDKNKDFSYDGKAPAPSKGQYDP